MAVQALPAFPVCVCEFFAGFRLSSGSVFPALQLGRKRLCKSSKDASGTYLTGLFSQGDKQVRMDGGSARDLCACVYVYVCGKGGAAIKALAVRFTSWHLFSFAIKI